MEAEKPKLRGRPRKHPYDPKKHVKSDYYSDPDKEQLVDTKKENNDLADPIKDLQDHKMDRRPVWSGPPTDQERKIVYSYSCYGATDEDICTVLRMGITSLHKYLSEELKEGRANAKSKNAQRLYQIAVGADEMKNDKGEVIRKERRPNLSALIFLAKTRLGWKETQIIESNELKTSVQIFIPHNNRMPLAQNTVVEIPLQAKER